MDLFYGNLTPEQQLRKLTKDVKAKLNATNNVIKGSKSFKLFIGKKEVFGNCCMFLLPNPNTKGVGESVADKFVMATAIGLGMNKSILTYSYPKICPNATKKQIIDHIDDLYMLTSIVSPKMIVVMGADACLSFSNIKQTVDNRHGTIIEHYNGAPVILTYHPSYYTDNSGYEDDRYKKQLMTSDWNFIKEQYNRLIGE